MTGKHQHAHIQSWYGQRDLMAQARHVSKNSRSHLVNLPLPALISNRYVLPINPQEIDLQRDNQLKGQWLAGLFLFNR